MLVSLAGRLGLGDVCAEGVRRAGKDAEGDRARRPGRQSGRGLVLGADDGDGQAAVPDDLVFVCEGAQPLIDVWIVYRRSRRAAEKAETEACHFWTMRCRLGTLRVEWVRWVLRGGGANLGFGQRVEYCQAPK
jgi:hypothetical protein